MAASKWANDMIIWSSSQPGQVENALDVLLFSFKRWFPILRITTQVFFGVNFAVDLQDRHCPPSGNRRQDLWAAHLMVGGMKNGKWFSYAQIYQIHELSLRAGSSSTASSRESLKATPLWRIFDPINKSQVKKQFRESYKRIISTIICKYVISSGLEDYLFFRTRHCPARWP